jgi:hypothetical protein
LPEGEIGGGVETGGVRESAGFGVFVASLAVEFHDETCI